MTIRGKPDISEFIDGAGAAEKPKPEKAKPERSAPKPPAAPPEPVAVPEFRQKGVRFPPQLLAALKRRALTESETQGRRVTEQEIIITALQRYLDN